MTGSGGFIGQNLLSALGGEGLDIYALDMKAPNNGGERTNWLEADLTDRDDMKAVIANTGNGFDACIHLAGQTDISRSIELPEEDMKINVVSVMNLLSFLRFKRFIYISTGSVYEGQSGKADQEKVLSPTMPYAVSKYTAELYIKSFAKVKKNPVSYMILRIFNPYGPGENRGRIMPRLITQFGINRDPAFKIIGSGRAMVDPMYVGDTVEAIKKALYSDRENLTIDICSGNPTDIIALTKTVALVFDIEPRIECAGRSKEEVTFFGDPEPARELLGFRPKITIRDGLKRYLKYLKECIPAKDGL